MSESLRISLVQYDITWENPEANREKVGALLSRYKPETDLIILPEMFTTGFSMHSAKLAEPMDGPSVQWMMGIAKKYDAAVAGSLITSIGKSYRNRFVFMPPDGDFSFYDKKHLFTLAGEEKSYTSGTHQIRINWRGWRLCPLICYDLRFPVWSRNNPTDPYDILLYVANWPDKRRNAWNILLKGRAVENISYVAAVNRIGTDGTGMEYAGDSQLVDYTGESLLHASLSEGVFSLDLFKAPLLEFRKRFAFLEDADRINNLFDIRG